jgi:hypothetical protein
MVEERLKLALRLKLDQLEDDVAVGFAWTAQDLAQPGDGSGGSRLGAAADHWSLWPAAVFPRSWLWLGEFRPAVERSCVVMVDEGFKL